MEKIRPSKVLYIKLGPGGRRAKDCIEKSQTVRLGYGEISHADCLAGKWDDVRKFYSSKPKRVATSHTNQIKQFYESDENVLWLTFYEGKMWWCFSTPDIKQLPDKTKTRPVIDEWKCTDIRGKELVTDNLSGKLVKTRSFRGTICDVEEAEYVIGRINAITPPNIKNAKKAVASLEEKLKILITRLHWKDFELLIDLIFRYAGWQRVKTIGKTAKTLDLDLSSPVVNERCMVQIKSQSGSEEFQKYCRDFKNHGDYTKFFYVVHTPVNADKLVKIARKEGKVTLWLLEDITKHVIDAGLVKWLISKSS